MKIDIYTSTQNGNKFLSVPAGTKMDSFQAPEGFDADLLTLSPFRTRLELNPEKPQKALDQGDVLRQLNANGFAIHEAKYTIKVGSAADTAVC